jgi:ketosteroid isomerase-like protein
MSADQNIETIQSIYEAFGLGDVEVILANVTDDVGWVSRPRHACVRPATSPHGGIRTTSGCH